MLQFLIIDKDEENREEIAFEIKKASDAIGHYSHITKTGFNSVNRVKRWGSYDAVFIGYHGARLDSQEFIWADFIRNHKFQKLMIFYGEEITQEMGLSIYRYAPVNYIQIPSNGVRLKEIVKQVQRIQRPIRVFIDMEDGCEIAEPLEILCFDTEENVIYTKKRIKVSNREEGYQKYLIHMLKLEGFIFRKNRYWVNRYWKERMPFLDGKLSIQDCTEAVL